MIDQVQLRLVIFDCDGTLVDSFVAIYEAMFAAFNDHGRPPPPEAALRGMIGLSVAEQVAELAPQATSDDQLALWVSQPLRLEQGRMVLNVPTGRTREGVIEYRDDKQDRFVTARFVSDPMHGIRANGSGTIRGAAVRIAVAGPSVEKFQ